MEAWLVHVVNTSGTGNGTVGNHDGGIDIAGQAPGAHNEPFDPQRAYPSDACIFVAK